VTAYMLTKLQCRGLVVVFSYFIDLLCMWCEDDPALMQKLQSMNFKRH